MTSDVLDPAAFDHLLEITGGDLEFVDELVDIYIEDGRDQVTALRRAAEANDPDAIVRPAHSLKSSSANVGATIVASLCRSLEEEGRGAAIPDLATRVEACAAAFEEAREALLRARSDRSDR